MKKIIRSILFILAVSVGTTSAQQAEVKITLDEQFFEVLLEAVFKNLDEPKVPLSLSQNGSGNPNSETQTAVALDSNIPANVLDASYSQARSGYASIGDAPSARAACDETVRLKREIDGVRTAVRFRNGKIYAPIAFEGNYNPPLIGCIGFSGWAETDISLVFDKTKNVLNGKAKVLSVNLSGTNGIGGSIVTRLVQNSIDRKINPLKIVELAQLSFTAPVQESGKLRIEAVGFRHEVKDRQLEIFLKYEFKKAAGN